MSGQLHCAVVRADRWSLLPGIEYTGRLGVEILAALGGALTLIVGDDERPTLTIASADGEERRVTQEPLLTAPSVDTPPPDYWFDGGDPARAPGHVIRAECRRIRPRQRCSTSLWGAGAARARPAHALRRRRARTHLCRPAGGTRIMVGARRAARGRSCRCPRPRCWCRDGMVCEGPAAGTAYRWTDRSAIVLVPSARRVPVRVAVDAEGAATGSAALAAARRERGGAAGAGDA